MRNLVLYYKPTCTFCAKVLDFMKSKDIEIPLKNILEGSGTAEELVLVGGKRQIPCLVIDGNALYESDDIIGWLGKNIKS